MVLGSANRELRIDPVTNTDMDPNGISAKVYTKTSEDGKTKRMLIKELKFYIQIPLTDMGIIKSGDYLRINLENYISLPEFGMLLFDWYIENSQGKRKALPSNFKVSTSGRTVQVTGLKQKQKGIVICVVYSPMGIAIAKRRFNMSRVSREADKKDKRSVITPRNPSKRAGKLKRRRIARSCIKKFTEILSESSKPISRKKRFQNTTKPMKRRFARCKLQAPCPPTMDSIFFDNDQSTLDPRVMSVQKLVELSERGDGTLDDMMPREVHYVDPVVTVVTDYFLTFSAPQDFQPNCSIDLDCGEGAVCVLPQGHKASVKVDEKDHKGYCYCKPEYFGDGFTCTKIPRGYHRDKRIKKGISQKQRRHKKSPKMYDTPFTSFTANSTGDVTTPLENLYAANVVKYEEADSYLVSSCANKKDCSQHAFCFQGQTGHPFCKCNPGYRGNGLFCWELFDYIKSKDQVPVTTPILKK
ncbi:EGF-like domain-containing protein [Caerostris darwini]|uniref:EGF-like domain-containing protein n=1 Tax=Caerostris darwini TaxID=1538125 RepID=A0AAV4T892_9ARAC|nr:EGF-like domain-containing protein [Caerostris darwini]